jgi:integrase/recombinase XerD
MSVTLRDKKTSKTSKIRALYLDIYHNGVRSYEFLNLRYTVSKNEVDILGKKEAIELGKRIAAKRGNELSATDYSIITTTGKKTDIVIWMQSFIDKYEKKDVRNMQGVLDRFKKFLIKHKKKGLTFGQIDVSIIEDFRDNLISTCKGEGASSYFARFKKMMRAAYRQRLIDRNPVLEIERKRMPEAKRKDTLTTDEIQVLANTPVDSPEVKAAFLFCCVTGLRWIDVKATTWGDVRGKKLILTQLKTKKVVEIDLNNTALTLIGKRLKPTDLLFDLPTANGANKTVKAWVKRAEINKKITWHNARHSLGTNLIVEGTDVLTVSSILGHSTMKHTQRYVTAGAELKKSAMNKVNIEL